MGGARGGARGVVSGIPMADSSICLSGSLVGSSTWLGKMGREGGRE